MIHEDFYTGEPVNSGSPANFPDTNIINTGPGAEVEAANMASFGKKLTVGVSVPLIGVGG